MTIFWVLTICVGVGCQPMPQFFTSEPLCQVAAIQTFKSIGTEKMITDHAKFQCDMIIIRS